MDNKDDSLPLIKKMILATVAGFLVLFLVQMSRMPPEGSWITDSNRQVLPSLRYKHINEPWAKAYLSEDKPAIDAQSTQPAPRLAMENNSPHSYFSSPRIISARSAYRYSNSDYNLGSSASAETSSVNESPLVREDLLRPDVMTDTQNNYSASFGSAGQSAKKP